MTHLTQTLFTTASVRSVVTSSRTALGDIEEGQKIDDARICVIEKSSDGEEMADGIIHLPSEVKS